MSAEQRDPAAGNDCVEMEGRGEMIKAPVDLQDLRRRLYVKAKAEPSWRFWGIYVHVCKMETLRKAYALAKANNGAPGIDGVTFEAIDAQGFECFLEQIRDELIQRTYVPLKARHCEIPKDGGKVRVLRQGESFGFLGFDFRRTRSRRGVWRAQYTPKLKKRTALLRKLKETFRCFQSQPLDRVVELINPVLRGWIGYFAIGHSSRCFGFIKDWVEKKARRHLGRSRKRQGFGWNRWSRHWLYETVGLFNGYRVNYAAR